MLDLLDPMIDDADEMPALQLPEVVDTPAVVLVGLLAGGTRPLVLDAHGVREIEPAAAPLLVGLLRAKRQAGIDVCLAHAPAALRARWARHALASYFADAREPSAEALFTCPDRDELGFSPSFR